MAKRVFNFDQSIIGDGAAMMIRRNVFTIPTLLKAEMDRPWLSLLGFHLLRCLLKRAQIEEGHCDSSARKPMDLNG